MKTVLTYTCRNQEVSSKIIYIVSSKFFGKTSFKSIKKQLNCSNNLKLNFIAQSNRTSIFSGLIFLKNGVSNYMVRLCLIGIALHTRECSIIYEAGTIGLER